MLRHVRETQLRYATRVLSCMICAINQPIYQTTTGRHTGIGTRTITPAMLAGLTLTARASNAGGCMLYCDYVALGTGVTFLGEIIYFVFGRGLGAQRCSRRYIGVLASFLTHTKAGATVLGRWRWGRLVRS
jgi:hypothetical protein